jgi:hypothetical protein
MPEREMHTKTMYEKGFIAPEGSGEWGHAEDVEGWSRSQLSISSVHFGSMTFRSR